jgi:hypothetical protein
MLHVRKSSQGSYEGRRSWKVLMNDGFDEQDQLQDGRKSCKMDGEGGEVGTF